MIHDLKPYSAYKDSGVPWLGDVPAHWEVTAVKRHYAIQLGKMLQNRSNNPDDVEVPYLKARHVQWFHVRTTDVPKMWASHNDTDQFGIAPGDLLVCEGGEGGRCGILKQNVGGYIIQNALHRVRPREQSRNDFLQYVMSAVAATGWFDALNDKATIAHFTREKFGALRASLPPLPEQAAIVRYLDHADRRIRRYISAKQKLIALLEEEKQAIIHQAVTGQIDVRTGQPYPAYKPSGMEWLGEVPEHWEVVRLKFVAAKIVDCLHETPKYSENGEFPAIRTADISPGILHLSSARRIEPDEYARWTERLEPKQGDILYSREGERFGIAACVPDEVRLCISQRMMVFRIRPEHNPVFVMWLLNSKQVYAQACQDIMGATAPHVNVSTIRNYFLALPARDEQDFLIDKIESSTEGFSSAISNAEREISFLREYRTRLIADVVTGKLDVRKVAAALPEVDPLAAEDGMEYIEMKSLKEFRDDK